MPGRRATWTALGALALLPAIAPAAPAAAAVPQLRLAGVPARPVNVCGTDRAVRVAAVGSRVVARVRRARRVVVERCADGTWTVVAVLRARRGTAPVDTAADGDYRLRARRRRARSAARYLRVGVGEIVDEPVAYPVVNVNRSLLACPTDGARYSVAGTLVGPRAAITQDQRSITVYAHGIEVDGRFWHLKAVPGYDYATELARAGHVSLVLDRLGAGRSGHPPGMQSCLGGQADVIHQVISALRAGGYDRVALAGHSFGTYVAQIEAYSFHDVDALVATAFNAQAFNNDLLAVRAAGGETGSCALGGHPAGDGGPGGYAFLWPSTDTWAADTFFNTDPRILDLAKRTFRQRAPCGDLLTSVPAAATEALYLSSVTVPVLIVFGRQDALFTPGAADRLRGRYTGSRDVTATTIDQAGHTLMLQRTAPEFRAVMSSWLARHGF